MPDTPPLNRQLVQTNRLLKLGYAGLAVALVTGYVVAQDAGDPAGPGAAPPPVVVDINKVGTAQMIVGVENPDGFAVVVDEEGKINIVHRDGTVIVPNRKVYSHVYQERQQTQAPRDIELP